MKKLYFFVFFTFLFTKAIQSQVIADSTYPGLVISNPNINLSNGIAGTSVSGFMDIDCDNVADIRIELYKGYTAIDGANTANLFVLNPSIQICSDTGSFGYLSPNFYYQGDTLNCNGNNAWNNDSLFALGNYGCMDCPGPWVADSIFIAYKNITSSQIGWIKIVFNLDDGGASSPITFSVPEVLSPCASTAINTSAATGTDTCGNFIYDVTITPPSCSGFCDGSIAIANMSGNSGSITYLWSGGQNTPSANNLCAGAYYVELMDSAGNTCMAYYAITNPSAITFSVTTNYVTCNGGFDGSACCTNVSGGSSPYSFMWNPAISSGSCAYNLPLGIYSVCVTDAAGCTVCEQATINEPTPVSASYTVNAENCSGCCDGGIQIQASGGTAGYTFNIDGNFSGPNISNLCAGQHTVCVTDAQGCSTCDTLSVPAPVGLSAINNELSLEVYPNPNKGNFKIYSPQLKDETVIIKLKNICMQEIYTSETIMKAGILELSIDPEPGTYLLFLENIKDKQSIVRKIIVQH